MLTVSASPPPLGDSAIAADAASRSLRVATYNIHSAVGGDGVRDPGRILRVLAELSADILALQEVRDPRGPGEIGQFDYFAAATGMHAVAGPNLLLHREPYGNALLSRWPVRRSRLIDLTQPGLEPRGAIDAVIDLEGVELRVIATHLGLRPREQMRQIARLAEAVADGGGLPLLVMGDFNLWGPAGRLLRRLGYAGPGRGAASFPARLPVVALDRIWTTPPALMGRSAVHRSPLAARASDHLPVTAELSLPLAAG